MEIKKVELSIYKNAMDTFHIHRVNGQCLAQQPHYHDYFQIYYVIKGNITHYFCDRNLKLSYGDVFIIPPKYTHYISMDSVNTEFYSFSFKDNFLDQTIYSETVSGKFLYYLMNTKSTNIKPKISISPSYQLYFENLMDLIMFEYNKRDKGSTDIIRNCIIILLTFISRFYEDNDKISFEFYNNKQAVLYCIDYIKNNFNKNITINDMINLSRLQRAEFCLMFKEITGASFNSMLNKLRIEKAIQLMKEYPSYSIKKISEICGYLEFSTFYRNFVKLTGISPTDFLKSTKNYLP